jgi:hypothetical protein
VAVRLLDLPLQRSLPELLEPFASLSPMVEAMLWNARATRCNGEGKRERAREQFLHTLACLDAIASPDLAYVSKIRAAIGQTVAEIDASLGVASEYLERLDSDTGDLNQRVSAHYVKKVCALYQGDAESAERHRRQAELLGLQIKARSMFSTLGQELEAHALARDLTGLKQVRARVEEMAARYPGWIPVLRVADAHCARLRGDLQGALQSAASLREQGGGSSDSPWCLHALALEGSLLAELGRAEEAHAPCEAARARCASEGMAYYTRLFDCALAQIETALGRFDSARARVERATRELLELGVSGLQLSQVYECDARIALAMGDRDRFESAAGQVAAQCRPGFSSSAYERLLDESRRTSLQPDAPSPDPSEVSDLSQSYLRASTAMTDCSGPDERAQRALALLCDGEHMARGYLLLATRSGLQLCASNTGRELPEGLVSFARACFEAELRGAGITRTAVDLSTALDASLERWVSPDGEVYTAQLLRDEHASGPRLVGVAMLGARGGPAPAQLPVLSSAVARHLIDSGDFVGELAI